MASTPAEFFDATAAQLASGSAHEGINALYQFNLSGDTGGNWIIQLTDEKSEVRQGEDDNAHCVISMSSEDFMGMIGGSLNPQMAFMTGKLRVKGDMGLALKLQSLLACSPSAFSSHPPSAELSRSGGGCAWGRPQREQFNPAPVGRPGARPQPPSSGALRHLGPRGHGGRGGQGRIAWPGRLRPELSSHHR